MVGNAMTSNICVTNSIHWLCFFFFSSRRRHTRSKRDWSSDVCSSDLVLPYGEQLQGSAERAPAEKSARQLYRLPHAKAKCKRDLTFGSHQSSDYCGSERAIPRCCLPHGDTGTSRPRTSKRIPRKNDRSCSAHPIRGIPPGDDCPSGVSRAILVACEATGSGRTGECGRFGGSGRPGAAEQEPGGPGGRDSLFGPRAQQRKHQSGGLRIIGTTVCRSR